MFKILRKLEKVHTQSTTCVETSSHDSSIIITGAERGELCLWSSKDGASIKNLRLKKRDDLSSIVCSKLRPEKFFVSAYRQVLSFDIRQLDKPLARVAYAGDCINHIAMDDLETRLAFAEDSGEVEIFDLQKNCFTHVLEEHSNLCNAVVFRKNSAEKVISGGVDNLILEWDVEGEKVDRRVDISEISAFSEDQDAVPFYVVSPPFVHSLSLSSSGRSLACGTENAFVCLFDTSGGELRCVRSYRRHNKGVSQVHFPKFLEDVVLSAGNDFRLCAWRLPEDLQSTNEDRAGQEVLSNHTQGRGGRNGTITEDKPLSEIMTPEKVNWLSTGSDGSKGFVVVVDSSTTPTLYSFEQ